MKGLKSLTFSVAVLTAFPAACATISGLVDTGAGLLPGMVDTNYVFSSLSGTATGTPLGGGAFGVVGSGWPDGAPWTTINVGQAQWLAPTANTGQSYDPVSNGSYDWTLTFNLTGYDPGTASFSGEWAADNGGTVYLNGVALPGSFIDYNTDSGYTQLTDFSATQGFNSGINTLTFNVINRGQTTGNPTGLLVDFTTSNASIAPDPPPDPPASPIPEPDTTLLLLAGLSLMGLCVRWRKMARRL